MPNEIFLIQDEAAKLLRISPRTLERHRVAGTGPKFMKAGKRVLYSETELTDWLAKNTFQSTSEFEVAREANAAA
jgi:hypothetical protein